MLVFRVQNNRQCGICYPRKVGLYRFAVSIILRKYCYFIQSTQIQNTQLRFKITNCLINFCSLIKQNSAESYSVVTVYSTIFCFWSELGKSCSSQNCENKTSRVLINTWMTLKITHFQAVVYLWDRECSMAGSFTPGLLWHIISYTTYIGMLVNKNSSSSKRPVHTLRFQGVFGFFRHTAIRTHN